ncbi:hypothetical protein [uncultured Cetobacterium sp.]|uniref:hypothetical protein n=1 Tax=uncultured Cetobacterium sp. TaxID=527638 RepID=UPI0026235FC3|nr:hypothetical protein [uncultured Cetobacterium sp.]
MKKLILGLVVLSSITAFAGERENKLEQALITKYPALTDGATSIKIHEYDVDIHRKRMEVKVELKGEKDKEEFTKIDKNKLETLVKEIVAYSQSESGEKIPVKVKIELDRDILPDETLYKQTF